MSNILIVSATLLEIKPLLNNFVLTKQVNNAFRQYQYHNLRISNYVTGIGMPATIYKLTKHLSQHTYDLIINYGIAGSFKKKIKIAQVVNIKEDQFGDLGLEDRNNFLTLFDAGFLEKNLYPFSNGKLPCQYQFSSPTFEKLLKVNGITVNTAHGKSEKLSMILEKYNADVETMEGAAVLYVARMEKTDCIQLRAISNYIENGTNKSWNIDTAIMNLNGTLLTILKEVAPRRRNIKVRE